VSRIVPGWAAGILAATVALVAIGFAAVGFFTSYGGLAIVGVLAIVAGSAVAAVVEPGRAERSAAVVAFYVIALAAVLFLLILPAITGPQPAGAGGGPGVYPPLPTGGAPVNPPRR
jgi:hypothetical protein